MIMSIIVPAYNAECYIKECIDSVLMQDWEEFELIIIDDGSTDQTAHICELYERQDRRIKVLHKENGGLVSARQVGCNNATGEYIINIDADDFIEEGYLSEIAHAISESNADIIAWNYQIAYENGSRIRCRNYANNEDLQELKTRYFYDASRPGLNRGSLIFSIWTKAVKRELYVMCQNRVPQEIMEGEDAVLVWLLLNSAKTIALRDFDQYCYRAHEGSMTGVLSKRHLEGHKILERFLVENDNDNIYTNQICVFLLCRVFEILEKSARMSKKFAEYKNYLQVLEEYQLFSYPLKSKVYKPSLKEGIKIFLLNQKYWRCLYMWDRCKESMRCRKTG